MAALDTKTTLFGAIGVQDPEILKTGIAIKRVVSFKHSPIVDDYNYEFLPIPAGFVMTGVYFKENAKCASGNITIKIKSDSTKTVGAAVTVGQSTLAETFMKPVSAGSSVDVYVAEASAGSPTKAVTIPASPADDMMFESADMLAIKASADMAAGEIEIVVHGYLMNGGSLNGDTLAVPYREGQTAADYADNKSSGDLYLKKVAAANPAAQ